MIRRRPERCREIPLACRAVPRLLIDRTGRSIGRPRPKGGSHAGARTAAVRGAVGLHDGRRPDHGRTGRPEGPFTRDHGDRGHRSSSGGALVLRPHVGLAIRRLMLRPDGTRSAGLQLQRWTTHGPHNCASLSAGRCSKPARVDRSLATHASRGSTTLRILSMKFDRETMAVGTGRARSRVSR